MKSIRAQRLKFLYDEPLRRHSVKAVQEVEDNIRLEHTIKQPVMPGEPLPPKHGMDHHRPWIAYLHSSNYNKSADVNQGKCNIVSLIMGVKSTCCWSFLF